MIQNNAQATQIQSALYDDYEHGSDHYGALNDIRPHNTLNSTLENMYISNHTL